jgi:hypothetical protein
MGELAAGHIACVLLFVRIFVRHKFVRHKFVRHKQLVYAAKE